MKKLPILHEEVTLKILYNLTVWIERYMHLKCEELFFSTLPIQDQLTLTKQIPSFSYTHGKKINGSMFYLVLGLGMPKITSNGGELDKKNGLAMTRGTESVHILV